MYKRAMSSNEVGKNGKNKLVTGLIRIIVLKAVIFFSPDLKEPINQISNVAREYEHDCPNDLLTSIQSLIV